MKLKKEDCILYAVTERSWLNGRKLSEQVEEALRGGVTMVQLREKQLSDEDFEAEALEIQKLCKTYQVPFLINDNVALAKKIDADGVHVGQSDMEAGNVRAFLGPDKIIGVTAKTVAQAQAAQAAGADYLGSGAVFGSATKLDTSKMDFATFSEICRSVQIPVVAIGGISRENAAQLKGLGTAGIAVVSAIFAAPDITAASKELKEIVQNEIL